MTEAKNLKVCIVTTGFPRYKGDMTGNFILKLVDYLLEFSLSIHVIAPADMVESTLWPDKYSITRVRYSLKKWQNLFYFPGGMPMQLKNAKWILWKLPFFLVMMVWIVLKQSKHEDLIHANWLHNALFGILPKLVHHKPLVVTIHGSDFYRFKNKKMDRLIGKIVLRFADAVVVVNKEFRQQLSLLYPDLLIKYIPNGVEIHQPSTPHRDQKGIFTILFVGNLVQQKGVLDLHYVFDKIVRSEGRAKLVLVGNGDLIDALKAWGDTLPSLVEIKGLLPHELVLEQMRQANLLVLPSYSEGRPSVVLEAMANGLPVLATDLPGIREILTHQFSGLIFKAGDRDELCALLSGCLRGEYPLTEFSKNALAFLKENDLSWQRCAKQHVDLYKTVLHKKR